MSDDLRVPKSPCEAQVASLGGLREGVTLYLSATAEHHSGPERPSDLLNRKSRFVPVRHQDGRSLHLNVHNLVTVSVPKSAEIHANDSLVVEDLPNDLLSVWDVEVGLVNGQSVQGQLRYTPTPSGSRIQDFLNQAERFFVLETESKALLVNCDHVSAVLSAREVLSA